MKTPTVYGDRICSVCKGICHDGSVRSLRIKKSQRQIYFCSPICAKYRYNWEWEYMTEPVNVKTR